METDGNLEAQKTICQAKLMRQLPLPHARQPLLRNPYAFSNDRKISRGEQINVASTVNDLPDRDPSLIALGKAAQLISAKYFLARTVPAATSRQARRISVHGSEHASYCQQPTVLTWNGWEFSRLVPSLLA